MFFADAGILIEGAAERILLPHFIEKDFGELNSSYISILEIGGSHAHQMKPLIEKLELITLIITDLDSVDKNNNRTAVPPQRKDNIVTNNYSLKCWLPDVKETIDAFLKVKPVDKECGTGNHTRVTYQIPIMIDSNEALARTFEDSLIYHNIDIFKKMTPTRALMKKVNESVKSKKTTNDLEKALFEDLKKSDKAEFALDLLFMIDDKLMIDGKILEVPEYIREGLKWLSEQLKEKHQDIVESK